MNKYNQGMYEGQYYHIYNRGNNHENVFYSDENYLFFLKKFDYYLSDFLDVYCYCLLPNHFHFLVRVKEVIPKKISSEDFPSFKNLESLKISNQFRLFFMSYSKAINKQRGRTGSLFQKNFKRKLIDSDSYLKSVLFYIHFNPQKHRIIDDFKEYRYSSYNRFVTEKVTKLRKDEVLNWFNGKKNFIEYQDDISNSKYFIDIEEIEV